METVNAEKLLFPQHRNEKNFSGEAIYIPECLLDGFSFPYSQLGGGHCAVPDSL